MSKEEFERHLLIIAQRCRESTDHRKQMLALMFLRTLVTYRAKFQS